MFFELIFSLCQNILRVNCLSSVKRCTIVLRAPLVLQSFFIQIYHYEFITWPHFREFKEIKITLILPQPPTQLSKQKEKTLGQFMFFIALVLILFFFIFLDLYRNFFYPLFFLFQKYCQSLICNKFYLLCLGKITIDQLLVQILNYKNKITK